MFSLAARTDDSILARRLLAVAPYFLFMVLVLAGARLATGSPLDRPQPFGIALAPLGVLDEPDKIDRASGDRLVGYAALVGAAVPAITAIFAGIERCIRAWRTPIVNQDVIEPPKT